MLRLGLPQLGLQQKGVGSGNDVSRLKPRDDFDIVLIGPAKLHFPLFEALFGLHEHDLLAFN